MSPIHLRSDLLRITVLPLGASLTAVRFAGQSRNMVLGFADPADHARVRIYAGALVGPVANRVTGGMAQVNGQRFQMPLNENRQTTLHSGPNGLHARVWQVHSQTDDAVTLACTLADGACGLPGTRVFTARYHLQHDALHLSIVATTDQPTPIAVAAHPYWNLDGSADVTRHQLQINAATYLPTDAYHLPTGVQAPVKGTLFDFTQGAPVPDDPSLDVNVCLSQAPDTPAATLTGKAGTSLQITTDAPGLQVYNGAHLPRDAAQWADGPPLAPYAAIALEPQHWPDALNNPDFPTILATPDRPFRQHTTYRLRCP